jgi:beta-phosphoglucomutase-like phosphatase (HAD superfamily)
MRDMRAAVFDLDGTLIDTEPRNQVMWARARGRGGGLRGRARRGGRRQGGRDEMRGGDHHPAGELLAGADLVVADLTELSWPPQF